jgi:hypothetical protein
MTARGVAKNAAAVAAISAAAASACVRREARMTAKRRVFPSMEASGLRQPTLLWR